MVPRTFVGPVVVSTLSFPLVQLAHTLGATKFTSQLIGKSKILKPIKLILLSCPLPLLFFLPLLPSLPLSHPLVRGVLGGLVCLSLALFRRAVRKSLGATVSAFLAIITSCQFHFLFYASRPLPNTFALILGMFGIRITSRGLIFCLL